MTTPLLIDGSQGEGGGQILRSALALSMLTGTPFRIQRIRANREKPGLLRQHLTAVNAATAICSARTEGAELGSRELTFEPGAVNPGQYRFAVGSAGSTTLVLQAVLPALLTAGGPSCLTIEGGTHNPHAPPIDFLERAFLPLLRRMGANVSLTMDRAGFYPGGGGRIVATIERVAALSPLTLTQRGAVRRHAAKAIVCALPGDIAKRELAKVTQRLGWAPEELHIRQFPAEWGPGNLLTLDIEAEHVTEVFTGFGMRGVTAEAVADAAISEAREYLACDAPVGPHLADQLLLPLAMAGGGDFVTSALTTHTTTNAEIVSRFLPVSIKTSQLANKTWHVQIQAR